MTLFSLLGYELYWGNERNILLIIISPGLTSAALQGSPSGSIRCVVMMDFSPHLRSSTTDAQGHFSDNLTTILICEMGIKLPASWCGSENQRKVSSACNTQGGISFIECLLLLQGFLKKISF